MKMLTVNTTVNIHLQIDLQCSWKNWKIFRVMVYDFWQISEFYLKNWIFENILNSALMWIIAVNASSIFKHQLFTYGANQSFLKTNYQHLHAAICVFSDFCLDNWIFYSGFKSACTTVNGLLNLWSHCCIATCQLAQSDRWQSLVPEVVSSSLKSSKVNIVVNCLVFLFSCLLLRIA